MKVSREERFRLAIEFVNSDFWKVLLDPRFTEEVSLLDGALDNAKGMEAVFAIARYRAGIRLVRSWIEEWSQPPPSDVEAGADFNDVNY